MIGKQYKAHQSNVIDLFEGYKQKRGQINDGVDIEFLENRVNALKDKKFMLAVSGEVKAGKSTFINALLGAEVLPSDVLQASSAIVQIFKSENSVLRVKFADGTEEELYDDLETPDIDEANERLQRICRLRDEYRDIPTTLIDDFICRSDDRLVVDAGLVERLESQSHEHLQDKHHLIEKYISERTKDRIPVEIEFGYPLNWEFDQLRIVDTPGVNATGGVQDVTFDFMKRANAILFIHPIKPIESESFRKLVNDTIPNRSQETLFLILTHAGLYPVEEVERLRQEAGRLYGNIIPENRILVVDSLLKLIHCDLDKGVSQKEIRESGKKRKILSDYRDQAEDEGRELIDVVLEGSRFEKMFDAIDEFSMMAPNMQLQEILEQIREGYEGLDLQYSERIDRLEKKRRNPQEFEDEIIRITGALERYRLQSRETAEGLRRDYTGVHSMWTRDNEARRDQFLECISQGDSAERVRKTTIDAGDSVQTRIDEFSNGVTQELGKALEETGKTFSAENRITIPKVDLKSLEQKAQEHSFVEEDVWEKRYETRFYTLWLYKHKIDVKVGTDTVLDKEKFLDEFKAGCSNQISESFNDLPNKSKALLEKYLEEFVREMDSVISDREAALEKEKEEKQSNEVIMREIEEITAKKKTIGPERTRCAEVLGDIA